MLQLEMLIRNFGTTLLKYVLVENTIMIFLFLVATLTQVGTSYKRSNYGSKRSIGPFDLTHRNRAGIRFNTSLNLIIWWLLLPIIRKIIIQPGLIQSLSYLIK